MSRLNHHWLLALLVALAAGVWDAASASQAGRAAGAQTPRRLRLYAFDCGVLHATDEGVARYHVTPAEAGETRMPVACYLIAHPRGTLMWDVGVIPDAVVEAQGFNAKAAVNPTVSAVVTRTLKSQLAEIGYSPAGVTYVAISHAHIDHTANLNAFAAATWLTNRLERDFMWADGNTRVNASFYTALRSSTRVRIFEQDEHDVFGDGQVVIKAAPGHTPGHQVLVLRLASTGRVMLSGDLYHYPPERTLRRPPPENEFNVAQSAASRVAIEEYLTRTRTALWIEHDFNAYAQLKKSPAYYD